jgi:hypothetical protein
MNVKGNGPRQPSNWQEDPNFYDMPFLPATSPISFQGVMATTLDPTIEASTATAENFTFGAGPAVSQPLLLATVAPPTFANHGQRLHVLDIPHGSLAPFDGHRSISEPSFPHHPSLEASSGCFYSPMGCLATSAMQYPWPSINSSRAVLLQAYAASRRRASEAALLERYLLLQRQLQTPIPSNGPYDAQMLSMFEVLRDNNRHAPL